VIEVEGLFLDVGASIGQSALSFRVFNRSSPILSLEPLPAHRNDLRFVRRVLDGHDFMMVGGAEQSAKATLYVPTIGHYQLPAQSALNREDAAAVLDELAAEGAGRRRLKLTEIEVDLRRLDELRLSPAFVKIDVEGAELGVLKGLSETIARCRPTFMIERSERVGEVVALLGEAGYDAFVFDAPAAELLPYEGQAAINLFYLPARIPGR
jgi:FkbM family methyltransferase